MIGRRETATQRWEIHSDIQRKKEVDDNIPEDMNLGSGVHLNFHSVISLISIPKHVTIILEQGFGSRINDQ